MSAVEKRVLVLGYGNPGREDDGLGPAFAAEIGQLGRQNVTIVDNYQLMIEDALAVADADVVWFVDADKTCPEPFQIRQLLPAHSIAFTSHLVKPEVILALAETYYGKTPEAYLLGIRGYGFEFREGLTGRATENLRGAVAALASPEHAQHGRGVGRPPEELQSDSSLMVARIRALCASRISDSELTSR
jgi:hydrogenase maturation protease